MAMSCFIRKAILSHLGRVGIITASSRPLYELQFLQNRDFASKLFSRNCSSDDTNNNNSQSFTVSFLKNSCGLSLASALSASKHVHLENPDNPKKVLDFFQNHRFSKRRIRNLTEDYPGFLLLSPADTLFPLFQYFDSKGISIDDLAEILSKCAPLLGRSLVDIIIPKFNFLCNLFGSTEKTIALIKRYPDVLLNHVEDDLGPNVKILRDNGVPDSKIVRYIHFMACRTPRYIKKKVAVVKKMGIENDIMSAVVFEIIMDNPEGRKLRRMKQLGDD